MAVLLLVPSSEARPVLPSFCLTPWDRFASLSQQSFLFLSKSSEASHSWPHLGVPAWEQEQGNLIDLPAVSNITSSQGTVLVTSSAEQRQPVASRSLHRAWPTAGLY